jgi:alpha-galactosidase
MTAANLAVLQAASTSVVLDVSGPLLPRVLHWGADLGEVDDDAAEALVLSTGDPVPRSALDEPWPLTLLPVEDDGWHGTPGLEVHTAGGLSAVRLRLAGPVEVAEQSVRAVAVDERVGVEVVVEVELDEHGVLRIRRQVTATGQGTVDLAALRALAPLPTRATEVLDLTGRWCRERSPQRSRLMHGTHRRASRRGRTGHDSTLLLCAGTPGFAFRTGEVWAVHVAWSGDHEHLVEALPEGAGGHSAVLGGGELLRAGEVRLAAGQTYSAPDVVLVWSGDGLDGVSRRIHRSLRARPGHPSSARPLVLNTWEAVYFGTDTEQLMQLADTAAEIGVERFVVDDGWFGARRNDRRGLGDWVVARDVWPDGLGPLVERVHGHRMQFGLWFEPEMVNVDSDLVRGHPEWVLGPAQTEGPAQEDGTDLPRSWRHQQALDLSHPEAAAHLLERLDKLVTEYAIDFIKWDHNRDLHTAVTSAAGGPPDRPAVHTQTLALYALLDELRARHPGLEIESCSSGGARVDLGILERTDRVWTSDCNDAVERQSIQRWTGLLLPPELLGTHVGPPVAHTTHRALDLSMRCATALFGHAGLEWDVTTCSKDEVATLQAWAGLYRELRGLLHSGDVVRADLPADDLLLHGVVSRSGDEAAFVLARLGTGVGAIPGRVPLPGLAPDASYRVRVRAEAGSAAVVQAAPPAWWQHAVGDGFVVSGALLGEVGLSMPVLAPAQALVLHLVPA